MSNEATKILRGYQVLPEMVKGAEHWNDYIAQYPTHSIEISREEYQKASILKGLDCSEFRFPSGGVLFAGVNFLGGRVSFEGAYFGGGNVGFVDCSFKSDLLTFSGASFEECNNVFFEQSRFECAWVSFNRVRFSKNLVTFKGADFGNARVSFNEVRFAREVTSFSGARFGDKDIAFLKAKFFGEADFSNIVVGKGRMFFTGADLARACYFDRCEFGGSVLINDLVEADAIGILSFRNSSFSNGLDLSGSDIRCLVDLTHTKMTNQISIQGLSKIADREHEQGSEEALCRLKELAESNKDHSLALAFHTAELRCRRKSLRGFTYLVDRVFDEVSEYGRSFSRPAELLGLTIFCFACIYNVLHWAFSLGAKLDPLESFGNSLLYSISQVVPFTLSGRYAATEAAALLFHATDIPNWIYAVSILQGLTSFILIFLIGLGLRNHFRI